eukprot:c26023_g1_i1.p1 GENE.c26023_g1_i1~~c26023_g1_i1.p1  ORF type:complete len:693 (-),score=153.72 c26023_g1_i1:713-2674(-)
MVQEAFPVVQFHHVQLFVDNLKSFEHYKSLEAQFNELSKKHADVEGHIAEARKTFLEIAGASAKEPKTYSPLNQDFVDQLITAIGFRITQVHNGPQTTSFVVTSEDPKGTRFVVTGPNPAGDVNGKEEFDHFDYTHWKRFFDNQSGRQGCGVLSFECKTKGGLETILRNYKEKHPLLACYGEVRSYPGFKVLEVAAYYGYDKDDKPNGKASFGTILRFIEVEDEATVLLPGCQLVEAEFDGVAIPAYSDHWVSNVVDRKEFISTLRDTLGFSPKVDFNAGVVAAGEAIIESTVTGNTPGQATITKESALEDNSQIYLPTNNALSEAGHVYLFLKEIGQGVQHIACRVDDLCGHVQRANDLREVTGEGFTFLNIPRSYYGVLTQKDLTDAGVPSIFASGLIQSLQGASLVSKTGIVDLNITEEQVATAARVVDATVFDAHSQDVVAVVRRARFINMYKFLGDHISEATYLKIVRNKVLVDIQGQDVLYQIFTSSILQREAGQEAPFLEFIQRVCSEKCDAAGNPRPIKPGCGGFGIRNFLTLFLSIEVSKSMVELEKFLNNNDKHGADHAQKMVDLFTSQLDESNPILTKISDAMTIEGDSLEEAEKAKDEESKQALFAKAEEWKLKKLDGQKELQVCSERYRKAMEELRATKA